MFVDVYYIYYIYYVTVPRVAISAILILTCQKFNRVDLGPKLYIHILI